MEQPKIISTAMKIHRINNLNTFVLDPSYFARVFKKETGSYSLQYRDGVVE